MNKVDKKLYVPQPKRLSLTSTDESISSSTDFHSHPSPTPSQQKLIKEMVHQSVGTILFGEKHVKWIIMYF